MIGVVELIDEAVDLPPGPRLSATLAGLPWEQIPNARLVEVLQARSRQLAHDQAGLLAGLAEIARATPISDLPADDLAAVARVADDFEWASHEIAAGLTWTPTAADRELSFATVLVRELPLVFAALQQGAIDRGKAKVFVDHLDPAHGELTAEQIRRLCARFVPLAPTLTTRQLSQRLLRAIVAIDPKHHRRCYRRGVRERGVVLHLDRNGTATLSAEGLPPDEAAAAAARLDRLAEAVKRAGHPGRLAQISADLFVGMLDGSFHGLTEAEILAHLLAHPRAEDDPDTDADTADTADDATADQVPDVDESRDAERREDPTSDDRIGDDPIGEDPVVEESPGKDSTGANTADANTAGGSSGGENTASGSSGGENTASGSSGGENTAGGSSGGEHTAEGAVEKWSQLPRGPEPGPASGPELGSEPGRRVVSGGSGSADNSTTPIASWAEDRWAGERIGIREGIEIRVGLAALLRCDQRPGEIPGLGPVDAEVARAAVAAQYRGAAWQFAVVGSDGYLLLAGPLRRRPADSHGPPGRVRGGVVELHLTLAELYQLAADPDVLGGWAGVLAEIADRWAERHRLWRHLARDPRARFARGALARHVQIRDRTCSGPGCTRPARRSDLDHTHDHGRGGATVETNIGPGCWRHHPDKDRGWRLTQPEPGHFVWRSPLGRTYRTRGEPVRPDLPEPDPPPDGTDPRDNPETDHGTRPEIRILWRPARNPTPPPPRAPDTAEEPPF